MKKQVNTSIKRNGRKRYHQGFYTVKNTHKYKGDLSKVRYLSSWELKFFIYADHNISIQKWSAESLVIPYQDGNGGWHRYLPDIYIEQVNPKDPDIIDRYVIEIKPYNEVFPKFVDAETGRIKPPQEVVKRITPTTLESYEYQLKSYQKNLYKWTKAKNWCKDNGMVFQIMHEKYMKKLGIL